MGARIEIHGKFYRMRRGELVQIPAKWVGKVAHPQTIRKRPSKETHKARNLVTRRIKHGEHVSEEWRRLKRHGAV